MHNANANASSTSPPMSVSRISGRIRPAPAPLTGLRSIRVGSGAEELAHELADALGLVGSYAGVRAGAHERFGTAFLVWEEGRIDVATRRAETYPGPGVLSEVRPGGPEEDLQRRDFTVNAIALALAGPQRGELRAPPHALDDLAAGRLRVLHAASFVEDPTRLLRAVRYEARLGFEMDRHTLSLARGCIDMRLVGDLASARLRDELLDVLAEEHVVAALDRMAQIGLDWALHPGLDAGPETQALVVRLDEVAARAPFEDRLRMPLARLALMSRQMTAPEIYEWLSNLKLRRRDQDVIAAAATVAPLLAERLEAEPPPPPSDADVDRALTALQAGDVALGVPDREPEFPLGQPGPAAQEPEQLADSGEVGHAHSLARYRTSAGRPSGLGPGFGPGPPQTRLTTGPASTTRRGMNDAMSTGALSTPCQRYPTSTTRSPLSIST